MHGERAAEAFGRLEEFVDRFDAEHRDYHAAMKTRLEVQATPLDSEEYDSSHEFAVHLADVQEAGVLVDDRKVVVVTHSRHLQVEADHRGPEHGIDGWVGSASMQVPRFTIDDLTVEGVRE